jgi:hypothetical protein
MKKTLLASTLLLASILGSLVFGLHRVSATGTASLSLSPASGSPNGSGLLTLDIHENSGATAVNAVETDLNFSTGQFNVIGITLASGWTQATFSTCNQGSMQFAAFRTPPGSSSTGDQVVATVTMQAVSTSASAAISFTSSSAIAAADGSGTNVWDGNTTGGTYSITGSSSQRVHVCGSVVKASNNPNVYLIDNGAKRPVTTPSIFVSQGFNWNWISTMTTSDQALATGSPVPYRDGSVIKGSTPSIYVTDNNQKRAITSGAAFNSLG